MPRKQQEKDARHESGEYPLSAAAAGNKALGGSHGQSHDARRARGRGPSIHKVNGRRHGGEIDSLESISVRMT